MLMIVKAEAVHSDEPRIWAIDHAAARATLGAWRADDVREALRLRPDVSPMGRAAIVDRAAPTGIESGIAMEMAGVPRTRAGDMFALAESLNKGQPTNEHTPEATRGEVAWQEMVWRQAFNAALPTAAAYVGSVDEGVAHAQAVADAALEAWKKRWQR